MRAVRLLSSSSSSSKGRGLSLLPRLLRFSTANGAGEEELPVGIIGCGLGGAALARMLHLNNVPYVLFERDASFSSRQQGYALTIQQGIQTFGDLQLSLDSSRGVLSLMEEEDECLCFCTSHSHVSLTSTGEVIGVYGPPTSTDNSSSLSSTLPSSPSLSSEEPTSASKLILGINHAKEKRIRDNQREKSSKQNFHVPRQDLRRLLLKGSDPLRTLWGHSLVGYEERENEVNLQFGNGVEMSVAGVVACDGIYSAVRRVKNEDEWRQNFWPSLISSSSPFPPSQLLEHDARLQTSSFHDNNLLHGLNYLNLFVILGIAKNEEISERRCNAGFNSVAKDANGYNRRKVQWVDGSTRVFSMPYDRDHVMWQLSFPFNSDQLHHHFASRDGQSPHFMLKEMALERCRGWHSTLVHMLKRSDEELVTGHPIYDRDPLGSDVIRGDSAMRNATEEGIHSRQVGKISLLGDAFHPMSPFKGQGANQALLDAQCLGNMLADFYKAERRTSPNSAVFEGNKESIAGGERRRLWQVFSEYEKIVIARASKKVLKSRRAAVVLHDSVALLPGNVTRASAAEQ